MWLQVPNSNLPDTGRNVGSIGTLSFVNPCRRFIPVNWTRNEATHRVWSACFLPLDKEPVARNTLEMYVIFYKGGPMLFRDLNAFRTHSTWAVIALIEEAAVLAQITKLVYLSPGGKSREKCTYQYLGRLCSCYLIHAPLERRDTNSWHYWRSACCSCISVWLWDGDTICSSTCRPFGGLSHTQHWRWQSKKEWVCGRRREHQLITCSLKHLPKCC